MQSRRAFLGNIPNTAQLHVWSTHHARRLGPRPLGLHHGRIHVCLRSVRQGVEEWDVSVLLDRRSDSTCLADNVSRDGGLVGMVSTVVLGSGWVPGSSSVTVPQDALDVLIIYCF